MSIESIYPNSRTPAECYVSCVGDGLPISLKIVQSLVFLSKFSRSHKPTQVRQRPIGMCKALSGNRHWTKQTGCYRLVGICFIGLLVFRM